MVVFMGKREEKYIDLLLFIILFFISVYLMYSLFLNQAMHTNELFLSDIDAYIQEIMGTNELYEYPYPVMFKTAWVISSIVGSPFLAMAIAITIFNILTIIILKICIQKYTGARILSTLATFSLMYVSMIYSDFIDAKIKGYHYLGIFSPNPWHNGTYMAARPFMILAFILGAVTLDRYENDFKSQLNKKTISIYVMYALMLLLVTETKPSYTIVHLFTMVFIMLYRCVRSGVDNLKQSLIYSISYIPTLIGLLYQYSGVFAGTSAKGEENGVGIELFRVWNRYTPNLPLSLFLAGAFPIIVLLFHIKDLRSDKFFRFSWQLYLSGLIMSIIFYEKGFRESHFNFGWGYMCGLFIIFFTATIKLINDIQSITIDFSKDTISKNIIVLSEIIVLLVHLCLGISYFLFLGRGGLYY